MLRFSPTRITIAYHEMTLSLEASFRLLERTGTERLYTNRAGDRLLISSSDVTLEHGTFSIVFTDRDIVRKFRDEL